MPITPTESVVRATQHTGACNGHKNLATVTDANDCERLKVLRPSPSRHVGGVGCEPEGAFCLDGGCQGYPTRAIMREVVGGLEFFAVFCSANLLSVEFVGEFLLMFWLIVCCYDRLFIQQSARREPPAAQALAVLAWPAQRLVVRLAGCCEWASHVLCRHDIITTLSIPLASPFRRPVTVRMGSESCEVDI